MSNVATQPETEQKKSALRRQFVNFAVYKVDPAWRRLDPEVRDLGKSEFERVIKRFCDEKLCQILTYSTMGMRADGEIMLWIIGYDLEPLQDLASELAKTGLGKYMGRTHSFLAQTKRSMYLDRFNPEHPEDRAHIVPGKYKYIFVYPFVKKRDWYALSMPERQEMMDEHIKIGMKYPTVKLNTTYSFGLDDQEFVVAFETDSPSDFLDLVQELRETKASSYTLRDTPILTCIAKDPRAMLDSIGG